jgi:hypothetical protein
MANALANLFTDIADSIRSKTGSTDKMSPSEFPSQIESIQGGGGGIPTGYKTVTFMNGDDVLFERLVLNGDDCPDPVTQGRIETPTKESTVQYHYTYKGWSEALTNITEDKVIYATYTEIVRKYTITYYDTDGTTVLHTEQLAYGSTPMYVGDKSGFSFLGWQPALTTVVSDTSYIAQWEEKITFEGGSWSDINDICSRGEASQYFSVGESRKIPITLGGVSYEALFRIAGFNHDDLADGSGKAAMTVVLHELKREANNALPVSGTTSYNGGWTKLPTYTFIQEATLPIELTAVMKTVTKPAHKIGYYGGYEATTSNETRFLLSAEEAGYTFDETRVAPCGGSAYELYQTNVYATPETTSGIVFDYGSGWYPNMCVRNLGHKYGSNAGWFCVTNPTSKTVSANSNSNGSAISTFGFCI